ncbi:hypothetical protein Y032_1016g3400 [Ancylostoma ceylanicum]|uniref:Uncharacterized protein n=1 Tax=Ancylostoma ceylanicum TaxID=53326 RepID=A0A016W9E4_9BILA|nr:hypothetical protein Y032_1016g3400 [Ancylostoma ceylanicum]
MITKKGVSGVKGISSTDGRVDKAADSQSIVIMTREHPQGIQAMRSTLMVAFDVRLTHASIIKFPCGMRKDI